MLNNLMKKIEYAKTSMMPTHSLYEVYGQIKMAYELKALTLDEYMILNHECVANGINNPKYFN